LLFNLANIPVSQAPAVYICRSRRNATNRQRERKKRGTYKYQK